jgi:hypothetical protein
MAGGRGIAFVPAFSALLDIPGVTFRSIEGLPAQPVELHLLWGRENRNPALRTVLDCLRHASLEAYTTVSDRASSTVRGSTASRTEKPSISSRRGGTPPPPRRFEQSPEYPGLDTKSYRKRR